MNEAERALRRDLALACRILAANDQGDNVYGHVTARLAGWERCWMKPAWLGLEEVGEDDLVLIDLDGAVLGGTRERHTEYPIHTEVMRARPDVLSVVHTHPKHSIALGARGRPLRPISHEAAFFWPPEVPIFEEFTELVRTAEQGRAVARALGSGRGVFLRNHGIAVAGADVAEACVGALALERASEIQLLAESGGTAAKHTPADEALRKREQIWRPGAARKAFEYHARSLAR
ncbi:MAG TPA: class II aldolase/adducin family protein [Candidatus Limnocylindria bacterium]|nr:class II aldolase/adducin family protein [Candidatus Limnocylindria bacterium]